MGEQSFLSSYALLNIFIHFVNKYIYLNNNNSNFECIFKSKTPTKFYCFFSCSITSPARFAKVKSDVTCYGYCLLI
jgi:hypothetical protein